MQIVFMIYVDNEIGDLKKVIIHFPDEGISRISPKRAESLLFDDIVFYPLMSEEYRVFERVIKMFLGEQNVFEVEKLIKESLELSAEAKTQLIEQVIEFEELPRSFRKYFEGHDNALLAHLLITGYLSEDDRILFDPIPNFMFTRDIAVTIKDHILITKAAKEARYRENLLSHFILDNHPLFEQTKANNRLIDLNDLELFPPSRRAESVNAEGGDIMMLHKDYLLIGHSERTTAYAIEKIKESIFEKKLVKNIVQINIPNERSYMHIDTLFTMIDVDLIACHKPIVYDGEGSNVIVHRMDDSQTIYASIKDFLLEEINREMRFVFSGGGVSPFQEREQWTDSCNLVALRPGVAVSYDRNLKTLRAFEDAGYNVVDAHDLFNRAVTDRQYVRQLTKTIITIPSAELSRARGGSHCMTCPILRN